jgi:hypothetical protein
VRARSAAEAQALGELCGNVMALATAAYVIWSTVVAFGGGTIPLTRLSVDGGVAFGVLWMCLVDPLVVSIALLLAYVAVTVLTFALRLNPGPGLRDDGNAGRPLHSLP